MARDTIAVGRILRAGLAAQAGTTGQADGHKFANNGKTYLRVTKATATGDITIQTPKKILGLDLEEQVISFEIDDVKLIGPFPTNVFNQSDGTVWIDYEATETQWTVEVYSL